MVTKNHLNIRFSPLMLTYGGIIPGVHEQQRDGVLEAGVRVAGGQLHLRRRQPVLHLAPAPGRR